VVLNRFPSYLMENNVFSIQEQDAALDNIRSHVSYAYLSETETELEAEDMPNFPTVMNTQDLAGALNNSQVNETQGLAGFSFLKMDFESGDWLVGQAGDVVTDDEILVNTTTIQHGWILWSGGRPQKSLVGFTQPIPMAMDAIGEDSPAEARSFQGALIDDGEPIAFDTNSYGGRKGVDVLLGQIKAHSAEGSTFLYPKVKLTSESYANKKRGGKMTFNPVFSVVAWCDQDGNEEGEAPAQVADQSSPSAESEDVGPSSTASADEAPEPRQRRKRKAKAAT